MYLQDLPIRTEDIKSLLSTTAEQVTVIGLLLAIIVGLIIYAVKQQKRHDRKVEKLEEMVDEARKQLVEEHKDNSDNYQALAEKYYQISTEVLINVKSLFHVQSNQGNRS